MYDASCCSLAPVAMDAPFALENFGPLCQRVSIILHRPRPSAFDGLRPSSKENAMPMLDSDGDQEELTTKLHSVVSYHYALSHV